MIRQMTKKDQSAITPLLYQMYLDHQKEIPHFIPDVDSFDIDPIDYIQDIWDKIIDHPNYYHYVYEINNLVVAYMGLSINNPQHDFVFPNEDTMILDNLVVHPDYRGQKIASQLIEFAKNRVKELGFSSLQLYVLTSFIKTRNFYKKLGFEDISYYMNCDLS